MNDQLICILGGTGFVGSHLAHRLAGDGCRVRILSRRPERHRGIATHPGIRVEAANIHDPAVLLDKLEGVDAVVNLVGILNESSATGNRFRTAHVELTEKIIAAMQAGGVRRLLHMSALNADSNAAGSIYLQTKGEAENRVHAAEGLSVTSFRPSVIFGPGDSFFNRFAGLLKITPLAFPLACPDSRFAPVYVGDVVEAFCRSLDDATSGERLELCGPDVYTLEQLVCYTRDQLGLKRMIVGLPDSLSRLQARVLGIMPGKPFSMDNYHSLQIDSVCTCNALPGLGIRPTPVSAVVPGYLARNCARGRYDGYRRQSRRG